MKIDKAKIYNLLLNHQQEFLMTLKALGIGNAKERIKDILDEQLFEIVECNDNEILAVKKKSTGEIFRKGCRVYYRKYDTWVEDISLNSSELFGRYYGKDYYNNHIRAMSGIYHLNDISLTKEMPKEIEDKVDDKGITKQELRVFNVNMKCPICKDGNLMHTGNSFTTSKETSIEHIYSNPECSKRTKLINERYPKIEYEEVEKIYSKNPDNE